MVIKTSHEEADKPVIVNYIIGMINPSLPVFKIKTASLRNFVNCK